MVSIPVFIHFSLSLFVYLPLDSSAKFSIVFFDFSLTVKVAPHEGVIRTSQP